MFLFIQEIKLRIIVICRWLHEWKRLDVQHPPPLPQTRLALTSHRSALRSEM